MAPSSRSTARKRHAQSDILGDDAHTPPQRRRVSTQYSSSSNQRGAPPSSRRHNHSPTPDDDEAELEASDDEAYGAAAQNNEQQKHIKQLVRFAMAHEFSRQPIRRADISKNIVGGRKLNAVFEKAQEELRNVWGMEMVELPVREKRGLHQRRTAQNTDKPTASSSKSYVLISILPSCYRTPTLLSPPTDLDAQYTGILSFILSLLYLNSRSITHPQLTRYLSRAELTQRDYSIDDILKKLMSQGYLVRVKDLMSGAEGDNAVEYHIGPRAKVEFPAEEFLVNVVGRVWGEEAPEDLRERVKRNVGVELAAAGEDEEGEVGAAARKVPGTQRKGATKGRGRGRATQGGGEDNEDYR